MLRSRLTPARVEIGGGDRRGLRADHGLEHGRSAEVEVCVVLPREADAAVHLDVQVRAEVGGVEC